jgi:hypothetical protein
LKFMRGRNSRQMQKLPFLFLVLPLLPACKDEPEQIPAYLSVEPFAVSAQGGAAWQKITEAWVRVNGEFLGAYTLPAEVPVLAEGPVNVVLLPGIAENGDNATPNIYPFLKQYETKPTLKPGQATAVRPQTAYDLPTIKFAWDTLSTTFDSGSPLNLENRDQDQATGFVLSTNGAFSGRSILLEVDEKHPKMEIATEAVGLPNSPDRQVWLELHHRSDVNFNFFLVGVSGNEPENGKAVYQFKARPDDWNKIYLNLTDFVAELRRDRYRLFFQVELPKDAAGKPTKAGGYARLDNIRLLHF